MSDGCHQCGRCCAFVPLPSGMTLSAMRMNGIPLALLAPEVGYYRLRDGLSVIGQRVYLDAGVEVFVRTVPGHGRMLLAAAPCVNMGGDGRCRDYENRPILCRMFDELTAYAYVVPTGCGMDPGHLGVDVDEVVAVARDRMKARE